MTHPPRPAVHPSDASVLLSVRGVPSWAAILIGLVFGVIGIVIDNSMGSSPIGLGFAICLTVGIALAVLAVRRGSIFTGMVQAPILMAILVLVAYKVLTNEGTIGSGLKIVSNFPTMAVATGVGLLLGLVRIIAQPVRGHRASSRPEPRLAARA